MGEAVGAFGAALPAGELGEEPYTIGGWAVSRLSAAKTPQAIQGLSVRPTR